MQHIVKKVHDATLITVSAVLIVEATYQVALSRARAARDAGQNTTRHENSVVVENPRDSIRELRGTYKR